MKACFMGLGYIGLPTAIIAAKHGIQIIGVDINPKVVEMTNQGKLHIIEPGMQELLQEVVTTGQLKASITPEVSDAYFMVVPTPFKGNHEPDISYVEAATRAVIPLLKEGDLYVIESTSPVGTTDKMAELIFDLRPELKDKIYIAYCPERVLPGNVIYELVHNDRVIGGMNEASTDKAIEFYSRFVQGMLHRTNCKTAEMCKLTENSSRDVQIAFANELSLICDKAGINVWELIKLANKHPRVNILQPGCGVGGHCIAMLTGNTYDCLELLRIFLKFFHQRSHLYGFGTSPENQHNLLHAIRYLLFLVNSAKVKNYFPIIIWQGFKYRMSNQKNDDISLLIGFFIICKFKYVVFLHIRFHY